jgi:hypothetical protein
VFAVSLLLGENLVSQQTWDVGRVFEAFASPGGLPDRPFGLYARGPGACLAATYAVARYSEPGRTAPAWYLLRDGFLSYRAFIDRPRSWPATFRLLPEDRDRTTAFDREIPATDLAFDALRSFELPQLLTTSPAEGLFVNALDGDRGLLAEGAAHDVLLPRIRAISEREPGPRTERFLEEVLSRPGSLARVRLHP